MSGTRFLEPEGHLPLPLPTYAFPVAGENEPSQTLQRVKKVYDRTNFTEKK